MSSHSAILHYLGQTYVIEMNVMASMPTSRALKSLEEMSETKFTVLPHGKVSCAGFARLEDRKFFLMHLPPKRRQVLWKNKSSGEQTQFVVWWPHTYIGLFFRGGAIENGYAMVAKKEIVSSKDPLSPLPMPNMTCKKYGHICEGAKGYWDVTKTPEETAVTYADYFMKSEYVADINDHWRYVPEELYPPGWNLKKSIPETSYEDLNQQILRIWESLSETDSLKAQNLSWVMGFTLQDLIQNEWKGKPNMAGAPIGNEAIAQMLGGGGAYAALPPHLQPAQFEVPNPNG